MTGTPLARRRRTQHPAPLRAAGQQDQDTAGQRRAPPQHAVGQFFERLATATADPGEDFHQLPGLQLPAPGGIAMRLGAGEQQVEQAFLGVDRAGIRGGHRDRLLEGLGLFRIGVGVQHQRVALEKFVLVFAHHRLAQAREAFPVDALQRIAGPVFAQADEFLGVADRSGKRHAAMLVAPRARQAHRRQRVAARQYGELVGERHARERQRQAERIGLSDAGRLQHEGAAPARAAAHPGDGFLAWRQRINRGIFDLRGLRPQHQLPPAAVSRVLQAAAKLRKAGAHIGAFLDQRQAVGPAFA